MRADMLKRIAFYHKVQADDVTGNSPVVTVHKKRHTEWAEAIESAAATIDRLAAELAKARNAIEQSRKNWQYLADGWDHEDQTHDHQPFRYGGTCRKCEGKRNAELLAAVVAEMAEKQEKNQ